MKTSELTGAALDWAVAKCEGYTGLHKIEWVWPQLVMWPPRKAYGVVDLCELGYSTDWAQGGAIIAREKIATNYSMKRECWFAENFIETQTESGDTPLIAAMRCYVASKLGDDIELPEELT